MIPITKILMDEAEAEAAARVIRSGWITQGPEVERFEKEFAAFTGAPHAIAVSSCTAALHLALLALEVGDGDEVVTVSHSFVATANAVRYCGAKPVFVDVDATNGNILPDRVARAIGAKTRAVLAVHQLGMPADMPAIIKAAGGIPVIEDAACAIGSEIRVAGKWRRIGEPLGAVACFSFHPRKLIATGDGGMLTTRDAAIASKLRLLRHHGMTVSDTARHKSAQVVFEQYASLGFNYRLTDIQAAVGRVQLQRLPAHVRARRERARRYGDLLGTIRGLRIPAEPSWARSNWQSFFVHLPDKVSQRAVMQSMLDAGIATRRGVMNAHREPAYVRGSFRRVGALENSEALQDHGLILPLYPQMTDAEQDSVVAALVRALE